MLSDRQWRYLSQVMSNHLDILKSKLKSVGVEFDTHKNTIITRKQVQGYFSSKKRYLLEKSAIDINKVLTKNLSKDKKHSGIKQFWDCLRQKQVLNEKFMFATDLDSETLKRSTEQSLAMIGIDEIAKSDVDFIISSINESLGMHPEARFYSGILRNKWVAGSKRVWAAMIQNVTALAGGDINVAKEVSAQWSSRRETKDTLAKLLHQEATLTYSGSYNDRMAYILGQTTGISKKESPVTTDRCIVWGCSW